MKTQPPESPAAWSQLLHSSPWGSPAKPSCPSPTSRLIPSEFYLGAALFICAIHHKLLSVIWGFRNIFLSSQRGYQLCSPNEYHIHSEARMGEQSFRILCGLLSTNTPETVDYFNLEQAWLNKIPMHKRTEFKIREKNTAPKTRFSQVPFSHRSFRGEGVTCDGGILIDPTTLCFVAPSSVHSTVTEAVSKFTVLTLALWIKPIVRKSRITHLFHF